jgi:hypothetical protein
VHLKVHIWALPRWIHVIAGKSDITLFLFLLCRLKDNVECCDTGCLYLCDLERKLRGQFTATQIGRAILHEFSNIKVKTVWNKTYWKRFTKQYIGLQFIDKTSETSLIAKEPCETKTYDNEDENLISLSTEDNTDMLHVLEKIKNDENITEKMMILIKSQLLSAQKKQNIINGIHRSSVCV